ncbi:hypothetical protein COU19_03135 [Candidatus Kaiserbacteria bacterium CG10_big_fil_rev_8_21_14_0_10_56_12]|uniref:PilN domain-containing protein n=1 Tax=Candidatus Kaiserbacteria bacterium CG10_big_fil_rev_8_21_14_0_10_56_12 TaxID=1974611 RepID=A0A2H0U909_9BACT|nr:MAG: hypothetical protein COU19_03135 [Candidatus Kaiserbacteria bacterium CG10_big_fil_rev_8_21_14_0_10_56_12]
MALPPNIPTSFTPRPPASAKQGFRLDFVGAFAFLSYLVLFVAVVVAIGVFIYAQVLSSQQAAKNDELVAAEQGIDAATAANFVRLDNRLSYGKSLLANHVLFSQFFGTFSKLLPQTVRFSAMHVVLTSGDKVTLEATGQAKDFNSLAVASESLTRDSTIKNAIFSHLTVNKDNSVTFALSADIDRTLISYAHQPLTIPEVLQDNAPATSATTTASTTPTL